MRKLLTFLLLIPAWCMAQTGSKPDFIRTPNSNFTIVDWNFKAKTFNLPHYSSITRRPSQDSLGTIFLSTVDQHIYIKKQAGSVYSPLAFLSDIPSALTFTNDFTKTGTLVGFADTLHRTNLPWIINNTSSTNPALTINTTSTTANIQTWNNLGGFEAAVTVDGYFRGHGIYSQSGLQNGFISLGAAGTVFGRNTADGVPALKVQQSNLSSTGDIIDLQNQNRTVWALGIGGDVIHYPAKTAVSGSGIAYNMVGFVKPSANGDTLRGLKLSPILGNRIIATWGSLTGGTGYPNNITLSILTGGTGRGAVASVVVSGGVIQSATIAESGVNYTVGDVLTMTAIDPNTGLPAGTGGTVTVATVTTYTGVIPIMLEVDGGITKVAPSTASYPSLQIPIGSAFTGTQSGAMWNNGSHLFVQLGGAPYQLDQQIGVSSIFGRNGNVVAQAGDYNTSQVTESGNLYYTNARGIGSTLTGYSAGAGTITSADNIVQAIGKLQGNITASVTGVSSFNSRGGAVVPVAGDYASLTETLTNKTLTSGTNTFPTFNQNTTGSAATLTTARTINGTSFNGSANITITANTTGTLTNSYGLLGSPFSGANQTWKVDTARGKLVTTYGLLDTIAAHGASAGYGINATLFGTGTVAADSTQLGSKAWAFAAFYTKNQINTNAFTLTGLHTFNVSGIAATPTDILIAGNSTLSTSGVPVQESGAFNFANHTWNTSGTPADNVANVRIYTRGSSGSGPTNNLLIDFAGNSGTYANQYSFSSSGGLTLGSLTAFGGVTAKTYITTPSASVINTTATLTGPQVATQLITSTTAAAVVGTLPSSTTIFSQFGGSGVGSDIPIVIINTGPNTFTVALPGSITAVSAVTGGTNLVVAAGASAKFGLIETSGSTAEIYRVK